MREEPCEGEKDNEEDGDLDDENEERESESLPKLRDPGQPSKEEVEEHNLSHLPHRSWCEICVKARAKEGPHRRISDEV